MGSANDLIGGQPQFSTACLETFTTQRLFYLTCRIVFAVVVRLERKDTENSTEEEGGSSAFPGWGKPS